MASVATSDGAEALTRRGKLEVFDDTAIFKVEQEWRSNGERIHTNAISEVTGMARQFKLATGRSIPVTIYQTNDQFHLSPESSGILRESIKAAPEILISAPRATEWRSRLERYDESYTDALEIGANPSRIETAIIDNKAVQSLLNQAALRAFQNIALGSNITIPLESISDLTEGRSLLKEEEQTLVEKGVYRSRSIFKAEAYSKLIANVNAIGRIETLEDGELEGSCVYIGKKLFLTAGHVFKRYRSDQLRTKWPELENTLNFELVNDLRTRAPGQSNDVAICRLLTNRHFASKMTPARLKQNLLTPEADAIPVGTPIYVIGHPDMADVGLSIRDDCTVVAPQKISSDAIINLFVDLTLQNQQNLCSSPSDKLRNKVNSLIEAFNRLYGFDLARFNQGSRKPFYQARLGEMPILGVDSDTFHGDSGGGVFLKRTGELIAVFGGGQKSTVPVTLADAQTFEYALPLETFWSQFKTIYEQEPE